MRIEKIIERMRELRAQRGSEREPLDAACQRGNFP